MSPPGRTKDSSDRDGLHPEHLSKRPCTISPSQRFSPSTGLPAHPPPNGLSTHPPNGLSHPPNPQMGPQHYRLEDMALAHQYRDVYRHNEHRDGRDRHRQTGRAAASDKSIAQWSKVKTAGLVHMGVGCVSRTKASCLSCAIILVALALYKDCSRSCPSAAGALAI